MRLRSITVEIAYDREAGVWYVESSNLIGLRAEAPTSDALMRRIPDIALDLLSENEPNVRDAHIEFVAHAHTNLHVPEAA